MEILSSPDRKIEEEKRPEKLFRAFSIDPEKLSLEKLKETLCPGQINKDDPTKISDGNEFGVYMSTNQAMVETAYAYNRNVAGCNVEVPKYNSERGIINYIQLPVCGIVLEIDTSKLNIRKPQISEALKGHYNNGFQGDEWISDEVEPKHYKVKKLILARDSYDSEKVVLDVENLPEDQLQEVINKIKELYVLKRKKAEEFKEFLESLSQNERMSEFIVKRKWAARQK